MLVADRFVSGKNSFCCRQTIYYYKTLIFAVTPSIYFIMKNMFSSSTIVLWVSLIIILFSAHNSAAQPKVNFTSILTGLSSPLEVRNAGDGTNRLFIVEQRGKIKIYKDGSLLSNPFINVSSILSGANEQGLLSLAFSPNYATDRTFYIYYTDLAGSITVARYNTSETNPDSAIVNSGKILLSLPKEGGSLGRNGGNMHFGKDGYLYIGIGDAGTGTNTFNHPQNGNSLLGKMLRIDVNTSDLAPYYTIPADNPYVTNDKIKHEIWAFGLRQPWRWSFDRQTGDMWIGDVGQSKYEEINMVTPDQSPAANFGWECYEADSANKTQGCGSISTYKFPAFMYNHGSSNGGEVVIGGYVYRGNKYLSLQGYYLCIDYFSKNLWKIKPDNAGGWNVYMQKGGAADIVSFGEGEDGELYAAALTGTVYKLSTDEVLPVNLVSFSAQKKQGTNVVMLKWQTATEQNIDSYLVQISNDGRNFTAIGTVAAKNQANGFTYGFNHSPVSTGEIFYRLAIKSKDGSISYSDIISIMQNNVPRAIIYPTIVENRTVSILLNDKFNSLRIFDLSGRQVMNKSLAGVSGSLIVSLPQLTAGTYFVQLTGANPVQQKIIVK